MKSAAVFAAGLGLADALEELFRVAEAAGEVIPQLPHAVDGVEVAAQPCAVGLPQRVVILAQLIAGCTRATLDAAQEGGICHEPAAHHESVESGVLFFHSGSSVYTTLSH